MIRYINQVALFIACGVVLALAATVFLTAFLILPFYVDIKYSDKDGRDIEKW